MSGASVGQLAGGAARDRTISGVWSPPLAVCGWARADGASAAAALTRAIAAVIERLDSPPAPPQRAIVVGSHTAARAEIAAFAAAIASTGAALVNPALFPPTVMNAPAGLAAIDHHCEGPNITLSNGVTSAVDALVYAADLVATGRAHVAFAGGFETRAEANAPVSATSVIAAITTTATASALGWPIPARLVASVTGTWSAIDVDAVIRALADGAHVAAPDAAPLMLHDAEEALLALSRVFDSASRSRVTAIVVSPAGRSCATALLVTGGSGGISCDGGSDGADGR